jgi:hypothetical protein
MYTLPRRHLRSSDIPLVLADGSHAHSSWLLSYVGLAFLIFLLFPVLFELSDDLSYKPVPAKILTASVEAKRIAWREDHVPRVTYTYTVNNQRYLSSRVFGGFGENSYGSAKDAQKVLNNLCTARGCIAYVDPTDSSKSLLKRLWEQPMGFLENLTMGLVLAGCLLCLGRNN